MENTEVQSKREGDSRSSSSQGPRLSKNEIAQNTLNTIDEETTKYVEEMKKGTYNILVTVRCRPLNQKEKESNQTETIKIMNRKVIVLLDPNQNNNNRSREQSFAFDFAFDKNETQEQIFNSTTKFLLDGVVNGFNATVFAYGATGAGKTYTMLGTEENPGIMPLTLKELFTKIRSYTDREYTVKLLYLEIYNENIRDLLANNDEYLDLREDPNKGVVVSGITEITANSSEHILSILKKGNKNRTTESTNANETSSRSHAILQIMVSYKDKACGIDYEIKYGKLSLVDLAGSERASATLNRGIRLIEGANINRSLLTLGNCINALCEANEKGTKPYVPYRDSKLTRLLKDSLGGNARTVMIANISPFAGTFDDTYNTLKYANRAKNIKTTVTRNVLNAQYHITNYVNIIKNLQSKINELEVQVGKKRDFTVSPQPRRAEEDTAHTSTNFDKKVDEISLLCEAEVKLKQQVINEQIEIINMINKIKREEGDDEMKQKVKSMKKIWEKKTQKLKEYSSLIDNALKSAKANERITKFQQDHLSMIVESSKVKISNFDLKFKMLIVKSQSEKKDNYIAELENQIDIRDQIIQENSVKVDPVLNIDYKPLTKIKSTYSSEFMSSNNSKNIKKKTTNSFQQDTLPPLSNPNNNNSITNILSDLREMNHNINQKLQKIQKVQTNQLLMKNEKANVKDLKGRDRKSLARNYSNNIRNINTPGNKSRGNLIPSSAKPSINSKSKPNIGTQRNTNINIFSEHNSQIDCTDNNITETSNILRYNKFQNEKKITESYSSSAGKKGKNDSYPKVHTEQSKNNKKKKIPFKL